MKTKAELRDIRYKLSQAIKLNKQEIRNNSKPHQRDLARMRSQKEIEKYQKLIDEAWSK